MNNSVNRYLIKEPCRWMDAKIFLRKNRPVHYQCAVMERLFSDFLYNTRSACTRRDPPPPGVSPPLKAKFSQMIITFLRELNCILSDESFNFQLNDWTYI